MLQSYYVKTAAFRVRMLNENRISVVETKSGFIGFSNEIRIYFFVIFVKEIT